MMFATGFIVGFILAFTICFLWALYNIKPWA